MKTWIVGVHFNLATTAQMLQKMQKKNSSGNVTDTCQTDF